MCIEGRGGGREKLSKEFEGSVNNASALVIDGWLDFSYYEEDFDDG